MISLFKNEKSRVLGDVIYNVVELCGLSSDEKPTTLDVNSIDNGSTFMEIDTGDKYMYDLENTTWYKIESGSGGGGSMEKFDYIIPTISFDPADSTYLITNTDVTDMLNAISSRLDTELEPLRIGGYLHNSDGGEDDFVIFSYSYSHDTNSVLLNGISYSFGYVMISNQESGWEVYHTSI